MTNNIKEMCDKIMETHKQQEDEISSLKQQLKDQKIKETEFRELIVEMRELFISSQELIKKSEILKKKLDGFTPGNPVITPTPKAEIVINITEESFGFLTDEYLLRIFNYFFKNEFPCMKLKKLKMAYFTEIVLDEKVFEKILFAEQNEKFSWIPLKRFLKMSNDIKISDFISQNRVILRRL